MAEFPALPLWTDAYLADTGHLSDAQHGLYLKLLMLIWRSPQCRVPNNDQWISHKLGRAPELFRPLLDEFCKSDGNWITQKRLLREWKWVKKKSKSNRDAAKSRWDKENTPSVRNANAMPPHPHPTHTKEEERKNLSNGFLVGSAGKKNGQRNGHVTLQDPNERLNRFQKTLAESFQEDGWFFVTAAADPAHTHHLVALETCKDQAKIIGKGWPKQWPASS